MPCDRAASAQDGLCAGAAPTLRRAVNTRQQTLTTNSASIRRDQRPVDRHPVRRSMEAKDFRICLADYVIPGNSSTNDRAGSGEPVFIGIPK